MTGEIKKHEIRGDLEEVLSNGRPAIATVLSDNVFT